MLRSDPLATSKGGPLPDLRGRQRERDALDQLLAGIHAGRCGVLVLRGEPGIGKTALLEHLASRAAGCRIARAAGVESEMELAFAALHQLCSPFFDRVDGLPGPQRDALRTAFGLQNGNPPDRFLIGVAVLSLLSDVAAEQPLLCLIDDAQWLDQASVHTLGFVTRRLQADSIAAVFATRTAAGEADALRQLPDMTITGLNYADARALLGAALRGPLDATVFNGLLAEARGNPLALLELPRGRTPAQLAFGFGLPNTMPLTSRMEQEFLRRLQPLPAETRKLLLAAAVEPVGDPTVLWRAVERLGIGSEAAGPAEASELIKFGARVRFHHPLVRSAVWRAADVHDLQEVHGALAEVTGLDSDRRAWHRAQASAEPDEEVAIELERSADRARSRGGFAAAAAFLERSAELTPDVLQRTARVLAAAQAKLHAGESATALQLLAAAETGPLDELGWARVDLLRAQIAFASSRGNEAPPLLLAAARRLESLDIELARDTYLDTFSAAMFAGRLAGATNTVQVAEAVPRAPAGETRKGDILLEGLASLFRDGYAAAMPLARRALRSFSAGDLSVSEGLRWLWLASVMSVNVWDDKSWHILSARHLTLARDAGALNELLLALNSRVIVEVFAGELTEAASLVDEANVVQEATRSSVAPCGAMALAAWRGHEEAARALIVSTIGEAVARGEGIAVTVAHWTSALLYNGLGRYEDALVAARQASMFPTELCAASWGLVELVESAARTGATEEAAEALDQLSAMTQASGTDWALGVELRSRALLNDGDAAERLYQEAIERLGRTRTQAELARARLLYGEWLRRQDRHLDARHQLRAAHELFNAIGGVGFGERARQELLATGEAARKRTAETCDELTAQEAQIARLAAHRRTNSEIGAQLLISPRTVEWHLSKVFTKLGVSSRKDLAAALPTG